MNNKIVKGIEVCGDFSQESYMGIGLYRYKLPSIENRGERITGLRPSLSYIQIKLFQNKGESMRYTSGSYVVMEKKFDYNLLSKLMKTAVSKLPAQQKKVYKLSREEGLSVDEIAEVMSLAPQSVKNTMSRALRFIRNYIEKSGYLV